jgi:hypothetical protein
MGVKSLSTAEVNPFAEYTAAKQRMKNKTHTIVDEALIAAWEVGSRFVQENKRLLAEMAEMKKQLNDSEANVRGLTHRADLNDSRGLPAVSLESMLSPGRVLN